jgi:hypothetical protein
MSEQTIILFRGRRKDNGQWIEGNYHHNIRKGKWHGVRDKDTNIIQEVYFDSLQILSAENKWIDASAVPTALYGYEGEERVHPLRRKLTPVEQLVFLIRSQSVRKNGAADEAQFLKTDLEIIEKLCNDFGEKHLGKGKEPRGRSLEEITKMHAMFSEMNNEQQLSFMLLYKDEIKITFDNDNTSFHFITEVRDDDDVTEFYLLQYLSYNNLDVLFKVLGAKASAA